MKTTSPQRSLRSLTFWLGLLALCGLLTACGGGGGSGNDGQDDGQEVQSQWDTMDWDDGDWS